MKLIEKNFLFRIYSSKPDAVQLVILCTAFSMALIGIRVAYTGDLLFLFLVEVVFRLRCSSIHWYEFTKNGCASAMVVCEPEYVQN